MEKKNKKRSSKLIYLIGSLVVILALVQLVISYRLATVGEKVRQWEKKATQLEQENRILAEEINQVGALSGLAMEAEKMGFARSSQVLHLIPQIPVALK